MLRMCVFTQKLTFLQILCADLIYASLLPSTMPYCNNCKTQISMGEMLLNINHQLGKCKNKGDEEE